MATDVTSIRLGEDYLERLGVISGLLGVARSEMIRLCIQAGISRLTNGEELVVSERVTLKLTGKDLRLKKVKEIRGDWTVSDTTGSTACDKQGAPGRSGTS